MAARKAITKRSDPLRPSQSETRVLQDELCSIRRKSGLLNTAIENIAVAVPHVSLAKRAANTAPERVMGQLANTPPKSARSTPTGCPPLSHGNREAEE